MKTTTLQFRQTLRPLVYRAVLGFVALCLLVPDIFAQGPGGDPEGDPDLVPIDGGLGFLLAAGVGYGVKKAREYRKGR
ncbi:MAG TPA: hypothetical protein PKE07_15235 [Lacibacter sp.]|nr:hypothetical protein [Lacibacter sp.]HMO89961.1 hypothetical protein [Lacibacter sp.]